MAISDAGTRDITQASNYDAGNKYAATYQSFEGILVLPLAEASAASGAPVEFVRVHQPYRIRQIDFQASKTGTPPLIAAPQDNAKEYLLSSQMTFPLPSVNADRSSLHWQAMGIMRFAEKDPWTIASGFRIGDFPTSNTTAVMNAVGLLAGGGAIVALQSTEFTGEDKADSLGNFTSDEYAQATYNYQYHFPSRFMVSDLSIGN